MRNVLFAVIMIAVSCSVAMASDLEDVLVGLGVSYTTGRLMDREKQTQAPLPSLNPSEAKYRLEWDKAGITDASGRCDYESGCWRHYTVDRDRLQSAVEVTGQRMGVLLLAADAQAKAAQSRTSKPGYDPRTAPKQGLWRAPQGILTATITFAGYTCREELSARVRGQKGRWFKEGYQVSVDMVVKSIKTLEPIASARAEGKSVESFLDGDVRVGAASIGGLVSRRARPDVAIAQAAENAMAQLADQLLGYTAANVPTLVIAEVNGNNVVITTADGTDVRDAGVVEGMKYALRGSGVVNPVTQKPSRGTRVVGTIEITSIDADIAEGVLLPCSTIPEIGATVTLEPYQSLHK